MKKILICALIAIMSLVTLTGCSGGEDQTVLNVYNWGDYIDESVLADFEDETGIKVNYEMYATNEDMMVKLTQGGNSYDVVFPSEYIIEKMLKEEMLEPLDHTKIPNLENIDPKFSNLSFDPGYEYSVPYFWGTVGILYNTEKVTETVDSWDILWDEKYKNNILMMDSQRDTIMVALKKLGYSMNTRNVDELEEAKNLLIEQRPLVLAYVGDNVKDMMRQGEAALAVVWSGEAYGVISDQEGFDFVLPKEGSNYWFDNMVIPKNSENKDAAHQFINFMLGAEIGFKNTDYVGYSTPNLKTFEMLDEEVKARKGAYPEAKDLENFEVFIDPGKFIEEYNRIWTEFKASN